MSTTDPTVAVIRDRSLLHHILRNFFEHRDFLEVDTPLLTPFPIPESTIELFRTDRHDANGQRSPLFMVPSPEVWMKRLLAAGAPSLFQISRCFRNGEQIGPWHRCEFTMLEWYALGECSADNIPRVTELLAESYQKFSAHRPAPALGHAPRVIPMEEAFRDFAGFSLETDLRNSGEGDGTTMQNGPLSRCLIARLKERGMPFTEADGPADLFQRLFLTLVEPKIPVDRPVILTHYPALIPTLARRIGGTPWADRWELYVAGVEIANCYGEENDQETLERYWRTEGEKKARSAVPAPADSRWPKLIGRGMPPNSGVALGVDRFLASLRGDRDLQGLDLFPIRDMIGG